VQDDPAISVRPGAGDARLDKAPAGAAPVRGRRHGQHADPRVAVALELGGGRTVRPVIGGR